jgi:hypothetical protein
MDRLALIIGNSQYKYVPELQNPKNDANDMAATLSNLGFNVQKFLDLDLTQIKDVVRKYLLDLDEYATGLFYYAGHGMQIDGNNYIIPTDCEVRDKNYTILSCFDLDEYLNGVSLYKGKTNICILDACRDNPFATSIRGITNGFAPVTAHPQGTIIAFSTSPDHTASDGNGTNGLYTSVLKETIQIPNLKIEEIFKAVRIRVMELSGDTQVSWEHSSLVGDFYFSVMKQPVSSKITDEAVYDYVKKRGDYYESQTDDIYDIECMPLVDAYYYYHMPIIKILRAFSRVQYQKEGKAFSDNSVDAINIGYLESWGFIRKNGRWYYKDKYVEMGDPLPLSEEMLPLGPLDGCALEINGKLDCINKNGKVRFKLTSNFPDCAPLIFTLTGKDYNAQSKSTVSSNIAESEWFSDHNNSLNDGLYRVEITCPIYNVLPDSVKSVFGERNRNLIGKNIRFDPIGGNTAKLIFHFVVKGGDIPAVQAIT